MIKHCLNPKCNKDFTPKNKKGVYCSSNCRAAHAYELKKSPKMFYNNNEQSVMMGKEIEILPAWVKTYFEKYPEQLIIAKSTGKIKKIPLSDTILNINIPPMPIRKEDEDAFEFAERKNQWKKMYGS